MKTQALYFCFEEYPCESPAVLHSLCSAAGAAQGVGACGEAGWGTISSPIGSLSQNMAQLGGGGSSLDLGWLSLAQIHTFRKIDLRSCLRETMKHTSSLMSPSSKIKPCSLATAEGSQWWQYLFSFWALRIVLDKRKMCCIARKKELLSMHKWSHRALMSSALQFTVLYIFTRELISVLLVFLSIDSKART